MVHRIARGSPIVEEIPLDDDPELEYLRTAPILYSGDLWSVPEMPPAASAGPS